MLMHNLPFAIDFATAKSGAHPEIGLFIIRPSTSNSIEAVAEGHVITRSDAQVANLVPDRTSESWKPCFPVFSIRTCSPILERWREVECHAVRCVVGHDRVDVLGAERFRPTIYKLANLGLIACFVLTVMIVSSISPGATYAYCARHLFAVDGMVAAITVPFLSDSRRSKRSGNPHSDHDGGPSA